MAVPQVMNESGPRAVTFIFAGYRTEMEAFMAYNPGLESRVKYRFHFDDYRVEELEQILLIKLKAAGWKMAADAKAACAATIEKGTTEVLRSRYNGRLVDNLFQVCGAQRGSAPLPHRAIGPCARTVAAPCAAAPAVRCPRPRAHGLRSR